MRKKEAKIKDLDGVIIGRIPIQNKALLALPKIVTAWIAGGGRPHDLYKTLPSGLSVPRTVNTEPFEGVKEGLDFAYHWIRPVKDGVKGVESKCETIERLAAIYGIENLEYDDDNPFDAFPIAKKYPRLRVRIIQDLTTGLLFTAEERREYPNVARVAHVGAR